MVMREGYQKRNRCRKPRGGITGVDVQAGNSHCDPRKEPEETDAPVAHGALPQGGFVFSDYGGNVAVGVPARSIKRYGYEAWSRW
jgi:hypothetical protein